MKLQKDIVSAIIQTVTNTDNEIQSDVNILSSFLTNDANNQNNTQQTTDLYSYINQDPVFRNIFELYFANILPLGLNKNYYNIDSIELDKVKTKFIEQILTNLNFNDLIIRIVMHLMIYGEVGVMLLDLSDIDKFIQLMQKQGLIVARETFDLKEEITLERDLSYIKNAKQNKTKTGKKPIVVDEEQIVYIKPILIAKNRFTPIKFSHYTLGYIVYGNPYVDDLSAEQSSNSQTQTTNQSSNLLNALIQFAQQNNIVIPQNVLDEIQQKIINAQNVTFVPASMFEHFKLPSIYENGILSVYTPFINALKALRTALLSQVIKAQDILQVRVDVSNITKANVGTYIQAVINQFKNKQYYLDDSIPITTLPTLLTPLTTLFIPTYNNNPAVDLQLINIPFQNDLVNLYEALINDIGIQTGLPPALINKTQQIDEQQHTQINFTFFNKISMIQSYIAKSLTNLLYKLLRSINPDLYASYFGLINISLNKPYTLLFAQFDTVISALQNMYTLFKDTPQALELFGYLYGKDIADKIEIDKLTQLLDDVKGELMKGQKNTNENEFNI